jgi:hypothetical protein
VKQRSKTLFQAASLIRAGVVRRRHELTSLRLPERQWSDCVRTLGQIQRATRQSWHRAAAQLQQDLVREVDTCRTCLHQLSLEIQKFALATKIPSESDIYRDLLGLESEFGEVECDFDHTELCVTTPDVTLEGIHLGPFQIRLDWCRLDQSPAYRVIALAANPAESDESVTHPHVNDDTLCEGDGRLAIRAALDDGRLGDFFLLVWRLLDTYAPGQAYVELGNWQGSPCHECGANTDEDDRCFCSGCDEVYCPGCMCSCPDCDRDFCVGCISTCAICDSHVCDGCRDDCAACREIVCPSCLTDGICTNCREKQESQEQGHDESELVPASQADVTIPPQPMIEADQVAKKGACRV